MSEKHFKVVGVEISSITCLNFHISYICHQCAESFTEEEKFSVEWDRIISCPHCDAEGVRLQEELRDVYKEKHRIPSYSERPSLDQLAYEAVGGKTFEGIDLNVEGISLLPLMGKSLVTIVMDELMKQPK